MKAIYDELPIVYRARLPRSKKARDAVKAGLAWHRRNGSADAGYHLIPRADGTCILFSSVPLAPRIAKGRLVPAGATEPLIRQALDDRLARKPSASKSWRLAEPDESPEYTNTQVSLGATPDREDEWWTLASREVEARYGVGIERHQPLDDRVPLEVLPVVFDGARRQLNGAKGGAE